MLNGNPHNRLSINVIKCLLMPSALLRTLEITEKHWCVSSSLKGSQTGGDRREPQEKAAAIPGSKCQVSGEREASQLPEATGPEDKIVGMCLLLVGFMASTSLGETPVRYAVFQTVTVLKAQGRNF